MGGGDWPIAALLDEVRTWYSADPQREWDRTSSSPYHRLEAQVIHRSILPRILAPASRILDIGCGPGRHALELAAQGHFVFLADISQACVADARGRLIEANLADQVLGMQVCSAPELSVPAASFDVALLYGPLYHLASGDEARDALERATSALRPGGYLSAVFLTRTSVVRDLIKRGRFAEIRALLDSGYLDHGIYVPITAQSRADYMPCAVTHSLAEAKALICAAGLEITDVRSLEGPAAWMRPYVDAAAASPADFELLSEVVRRTADRPELIESGDHFAITARLPTVPRGDRSAPCP